MSADEPTLDQKSLLSESLGFFQNFKQQFFGNFVTTTDPDTDNSSQNNIPGYSSGDDEKKFESHSIQSEDDVRALIMKTSQLTWRLDDFEKKQFLNVNFFQDLQPGETFWDFYKKLVYSVHPEILAKKEQIQKMSFDEILELSSEYSNARREYLLAKRNHNRKSKAKDSDDDEENGSDIFGKESKNKSSGSIDSQNSASGVSSTASFDRGHDYSWFKNVPITNKAEIKRIGRDFNIEVYKDNLDDINPLFAEYPKHDNPYVDIFLHRMEKFNQWQTTRLLSMGFLCTFPILVGMVLARQVPMNLGGGDMFKILKSKMVYKGGFHGTMNRREAGLVLGVKQSATKEEIRSRHRKLMVFNHPDNGGSQYIAAKINEAKELMLKGEV